LRSVDRPAAVRRRHPAGNAGVGPVARACLAQPVAAEPLPRPGHGLPEGAGQGAGTPLPQRHRPGRRFAALPGRPAGDGRAVAYRRSGQVGQRYQCLAELKEALRLQPSAELRREIRNEALAALILPDAEVARAWDGWPEGSTSIAWDASLKRYAHLGREGAV